MRKSILLLAMTVAAACHAATRKYVNEQYDLVRLGEGLYGFIAPAPNSGVVQSNCLVVIGEHAVLVVDTGQFPSLAQRMAADVRKLTRKPVRYVVNTHWHGDHHWGNSAFKDAFPGLSIVATNYTRQMILTQGPKMLAETPKQNKEQAELIRKRLAEGKLRDGTPVSAEAREDLMIDAETLERINREIPYTRSEPPNIGFEKDLTIDLGKREVKLLWLGRANTGGDAIVWVPDARVLAAGDTVVWPVPFAYGSYPSEWAAVIRQMVDLKPAIVVPGHGPVMRDISYLEKESELLTTLSAQVRQAVAGGFSLEETEKIVTLENFRQAMPGDVKLRDRFWRGGFIRPAIDRAYQEATGKMKPEAEE